MRKKFIAGNWKMNTRSIDGELLASAVVSGLGSETRVSVAVCPPFPFLARVAQAVKGTPVALGAQNCYPKDDGAFTGEVSPAMLVDVGCQYVIVGHSERRQIFKESDAFINDKVHAALKAKLRVILCIGETPDERKANQTDAVLDKQLTSSLAKVTADMLKSGVLKLEKPGLRLNGNAVPPAPRAVKPSSSSVTICASTTSLATIGAGASVGPMLTSIGAPRSSRVLTTFK